MRHNVVARRCALLAAVSSFGLISTPAYSQITKDPVATEQIVANHEVDPLGPASVLPGINSPAQQAASVYSNSPQVLDPAGSINGVGQQIAFIQTGPTTAGLSLCTGTLINPRTVITAAHCLYNNPAHMYGSNTGTGGGVSGAFGAGGAVITSQGIPLSFGFESLNRNCFNADGVPFTCPAGQKGPYETWRDSGFQTNVARHIYNANQVWYGTGAQPVALGGGGEFANQDIAIVTLDTHAQDIPTWAVLFSPLDGPTHATITGYGGAGVGLSGLGNLAGIDYRRRSAENMIDALMTNNDWVNSPAINPGNTAFAAHQHAIYWMDFDDPDHDPENLPANFFNSAPPPARNNGYYDFNGLGGSALPNEGTTAGGDSGGPLIVDQRWDIPVVAAVLTGSWSFNGGISTYGQFNVYPLLFQFWEEIVQNNPYKYASALAGDGDWFDPTHWVQDMDPNYMVIGPDGQLLNQLPDNPQGGADGAVDKFGTLCFLEADCTTFDGPGAPPGDGIPHYTAGGPGTTNFVPNNVEPVNSATAGATVKARYYDVTLREAGTTTLNAPATIDKMTVNGAGTKLIVGAAGTLNVWADYTQVIGWTQVDGTLKTSEMVIGTGLLTGTGTIDPTYLTVVGGMVAPNENAIGTLTVKGDVILSSASALNISVAPEFSDKLLVIADASNGSTGILALNGGSVIFSRADGIHNPKYGGTWVFASAEGGVDGRFGSATAGPGAVKLRLNYTANDVIASISASPFSTVLVGASASELAFANALDSIRSDAPTELWGLYNSIDWMGGTQLSAAFASLTPKLVGDVGALQERQSDLLLTDVGNRLSLLASGRANGLTISGNLPMAFEAQNHGVQSGKLGFGASNGGGTSVAFMPGRMSGFVSGGVDRTASSYGSRDADASQRGWHMAMGVEMPLGEDGAIGAASGIADGQSSPGGEHGRSRTTMAAAYASMPLGDGFYVGGLVAAEWSRASLDRLSTDGSSLLRMDGATNSTRYSALAEAGFEQGLGRGLTLTPRAQLGYSHYKLNGFTEDGGETALRLSDVNVSRIEARLGAKLEGRTRLAGVSVVPMLSADYVRLLAGREMGATVRFAVAPGEAFYLPLSESSIGFAEFKGGVTFGDGPLTLGLSGQGAFGADNMSDQRAQADLRFRF